MLIICNPQSFLPLLRYIITQLKYICTRNETETDTKMAVTSQKPQLRISIGKDRWQPS